MCGSPAPKQSQGALKMEITVEQILIQNSTDLKCVHGPHKQNANFLLLKKSLGKICRQKLKVFILPLEHVRC